MMEWIKRAITLGLAVGLIACSQDENSKASDAGGLDAARPDAGGLDAARPDAGGLDAARPDAGGLDAARPDAGGLDAARPDAGGLDAARLDAALPDAELPDAALISNAYGFPITDSRAHEVPCIGEPCSNPTETRSDRQRICTLHYPEGLRYVYIKARPVRMYCNSDFEWEGCYMEYLSHAWLSDGVTASPVDSFYSDTDFSVMEGDQTYRYVTSCTDEDTGEPCSDFDCLEVGEEERYDCDVNRGRPEECWWPQVTESPAR